MSQDLASPAAASASASIAWSATPAAAPLVFRKDTDDGFPLGGAILLIVLMVAAVWAWWYGRVRGSQGVRLPALLASLNRPGRADGELRLVETLSAAGGLRVMVIEWAGGRRVLVAANGANVPVTLDVVPAATPEPGDAA